jgi:hypothetical protein
MVERSVEQSVPPAGSEPRDFTTARLSRALMHASAAAGDDRGEMVESHFALQARSVRVPLFGFSFCDNIIFRVF